MAFLKDSSSKQLTPFLYCWFDVVLLGQFINKKNMAGMTAKDSCQQRTIADNIRYKEAIEAG